MLSTFPLCIKGWLEIRDNNYDEALSEEWRSSGIINTTSWHSKFCILMENDSKFYIFNDESSAEELLIPNHIAQCRIDNELNICHMTDSFIDDGSITSSKNQDSERYASNVSLSRRTSSKTSRRGGFFRNGSRFFRFSKENRKLSDQTNNSNIYENNQSSKSVSNLKRSLSLSRINSKKYEEKSGSKNSYNKSKNSAISQSTGDLTLVVNTLSVIRHSLTKDTNICEVHPSLVGKKSYCFSLTSHAEDINIGSKLESKSSHSLNTRTVFAASTNLERQCWMKRIQLTLKPNMENENRLNNSLKLTIFESKQLPTPKRRYYCEVSLDKTIYAKTASKLVSNEGCVFWAEDLTLKNLPNFKTLMISLFKEALSGKEFKRKRKKPICIGQLILNLSSLNNKNELQSWFTLKSPDLLPDLSSNNLIQLRIRVCYQSLKVLRNDIYVPLYEIVTNRSLELVQLLETNIPIKLKEEVAICLVNIHEKNGTILKFLIDIISEETSDLENSSMALRANTIVTKVIESHMKLVGLQYIRDMLHSFIRDVLYQDITIEVDSSRFNADENDKDKLLFDNQHLLTQNLKQIWFRIYQSRFNDFPRQLKSIFVGWRKKLTSKVMKEEDREKVHNHCDLIISGCVFLRLICPAILSPHLFGLVPYFFEKPCVQRTLTLIAKSLQSLANFSTFGEKEPFMAFLNLCFEEEIPRMRDFLRSISSFQDDEIEALNKDIHCYGSVIDLPLEIARLHTCLVSDCVKQNITNVQKSPYILQLQDIIHKISQQLISFNVSQSSSSFFSSKKSQIPNILSLEQRRISSGQLLSITIIDNEKNGKGSSPPLLGSPILASTLVDTVSEYTVHNAELWQKKMEQSNILLNKSPKSYRINATNSKDNLSNNIKSQLYISTPRRSAGNVIDAKNNKRKSSQESFSSTRNNESRIKSSSHKDDQSFSSKGVIPSKLHFRRSSVKIMSSNNNDTVNDSLLLKHQVIRKCSQPNVNVTSVNNDEFYRNNPLYDTPNITMANRSSLDSNTYCSNAIDRYFDIRNQLNLFEKKVSYNDKGSKMNEDLHNLRREIDFSRKQVQRDQMHDLKHLNDMLSYSKSSAINRIYSRSSSQKYDKSDSAMTDAFDDVIKSIATDGIGLDETKENLRKKGKFNSKYSPPILTHESSMVYNSDNIQIVSIDISDDPPSIVDPPSNENILSSNRSSLMRGLI